jgi:hypothetical protein
VLRPSGSPSSRARVAAGLAWADTNLVFTTSVGTQLDAANVRRAYRRVIAAAGLDPPRGHHANYGTRSSRCCPPAASTSRPSPT